MIPLLKEDESEFKILKGTYKTKEAPNKPSRDIPIFYLKGDSMKLAQAEGIVKKGNRYDAMFDWGNRMIYWWQDRKDPQITINTKIKPLIDRINQFYKYAIEIDKLIADISEYTPSETPTNKNSSTDVILNNPEERSKLVSSLENYKQNLATLGTDEEFKERIAALMDFKRGQGYEYTLNNVILIKSQNPEATNVNSRSNWKKLNRNVNPNAKPIFVNRPVTKRAFSTDKAAEEKYLKTLGKTSSRELVGGEKIGLQNAVFNARPKVATVFEYVGHYDISDTTQIEGTEDFVGKRVAAAKKVNFDNPDGPESNIVSDEIRPIYNGLLAYAADIHINVNEPSNDKPNVNVPTNAGNDAKITKNLAQDIFTELLHKPYFKNQNAAVVKNLYIGGDNRQIMNQQAELASWMFLRQYGIDFKTSPMTLSKIWGNDPKNIDKVANTVTSAVNRVIEYVNKQIKNNTAITEIEGTPKLANPITKMDVIKMMGAEDQYAKANLQERLRRKVLRLI